MDPNKLIEILKSTTDSNQREAAEQQLEQIHKIVGFAPNLLQVVMMTNLEMSVRQAGVIFFKNMLAHYWKDREQEPGKPAIFAVHEQDRAVIRDNIVDAVVYAPELIRYKKPEDKGPLNEAMNLLLPMIYQRCVQLLPDPSDVSVLLQKQILKVFFALVQYFLPLDLISKEVFSQWMEICRAVVGRPVPEQATTLHEDEQADLSWWKCKKWALHILCRVFKRYGSPGNVSKEYEQFAVHYLQAFTAGILEVLLKLLDQYRHKIFVSPRVLQLSLNYINEAVAHAFSWELLQPHMLHIIQDVVFPLMCCNEVDEELWNTDPHEYIRSKFDIFEDFFSPVTAAQTLLHSVAKKQKDMLQKVMEFVMTVLKNPSSTPYQKDGALRMLGSVSDVLLKTQLYREQMENIIVTYVYPHFQSEHGFMRARACWVVHYFCEINFRSEQNFITALQLTQNCLLNDKELPVKVEATLAMQTLISNKEKAQKHIEMHIQRIALEVFNIFRETQNEDINKVLLKMICMYSEKLTPIFVEMTHHLAQTFSQVVNSGDENSDENTITSNTALGVLNTIDTILCVMENKKEIMALLEPIVLDVIRLILTESVFEFYEEAMTLICNLSSNSISPDMWKVLKLLVHIFKTDGVEFFTDMMPALHNFVRVDTQAFVSDESHLLAMYKMCETVLNSKVNEDNQCHAAKLLEVIILQCKGLIDECIPSFVKLALARLNREMITSELKTMCLQVVIAALYYNPTLLLNILEENPLPNATDTITHFIQQWVSETDCFFGLHDRKLCILGLSIVLSIPAYITKVKEDVVKKIIPSMLVLFAGLKRAYAYKAHAQEEDADSEEEEKEEEYDQDVLDSDEDDENDDGKYCEGLSNGNKSPFPVTSASIVDDDDDAKDDKDDDDDDVIEKTDLDNYTTPLEDEDNPVDEYVVFKEVLHNIKNADPYLYTILTSHLTLGQHKVLKEVFVLADQRKEAAESRRI